jgi:hypothetical protein
MSEQTTVYKVNIEIGEEDVVDDGIIIDESNFHEYFFDIRRHRPKTGQVMARFEAVAELIDGQMKRDIVYLLSQGDKGGLSSQKVMRKLGGATEADSIRVPKEIATDLLNGMTVEEVYQKIYTYHYESFYYTERKNIPKNDPHWSIISIRVTGEEDNPQKIEGEGVNTINDS